MTPCCVFFCDELENLFWSSCRSHCHLPERNQKKNTQKTSAGNLCGACGHILVEYAYKNRVNHLFLNTSGMTVSLFFFHVA